MKPLISLFVVGAMFQSLVLPSRAQETNLSGDDTEIALPPVVVERSAPPAAVPKPDRSPPIGIPKSTPAPSQRQPVKSEVGEQRPADLPAAMSRVDRQQIENWQVRRIDQIVAAVPNANLSGFGDGRSTNLTIRGVGPLTDQFAPDDNTAVVYIDGVPQLLFSGDASLFDLERVDVFKGPQGTRFGLNTTGGAVNYITRKPLDPGGEARTEIGEQGYLHSQVAASQSTTDGAAAARVALQYSEIDGFVPNVVTGNDAGARNVVAGRGTVVLKPSTTTTVTVSARSEDDQRTFPYFLLRDTAKFPVELQSTEAASHRAQTGASFVIESKIAGTKVKSLTGVSDFSTSLTGDDTDGFLFSRITGLPAAVFAADKTVTDWRERQRLWSQEFRWESLENASVDWVTGVILYDNRFTADYFNTHSIFTVNNGQRTNDLQTQSAAAFGELTVPLAIGTRLTGGIRATHDEKTYDSRFTGIGFPGTVQTYSEKGTLAYDYVTGRLSLAQDLSPSDTIFASVSRGEKSGGFPRLPSNAAVGIPTTPYRSTIIVTYEGGAQHKTADGSKSIDANIFLNDVDDEQLFVFDSATFGFRPENIDIRSFGAELALGWSLMSPLRLTAGLGVIEAEIRNPSSQQQAIGAREGNRPTNTPAITAFMRLDYRENLQLDALDSGSAIFANFGWSYTGNRAANVANDFLLEDYHLIDARAGLAFRPGCELYVYGHNLLDIIPEQVGTFVAGTKAVVPDRGRVAGIGFAASW